MAVITDLISKLRFKVGDTTEPYVFIDARLTDLLTEALHRYNPKRQFADLQGYEYDFLVVLAWIDICYIIASDHAKYMGLSIVGMSVDKSIVFRNYLELAKYLEEMVKKQIDESGADSIISSMGQIEMGMLTRESLETQRTVPYIADIPPEPVGLLLVKRNGFNVYLKWTVCYESDFGEYRLYRTIVSGTEGTLLYSQTDNHIVEFMDTVTEVNTYYYYVKLLDTNGLSSKSPELIVVAN